MIVKKVCTWSMPASAAIAGGGRYSAASNMLASGLMSRRSSSTSAKGAGEHVG
eukprot:CAMPEP_0183336182 /NCGR_PEP_ID=MMETSP0164_2-20130417/4240_1 /TAXON_ID=221442 /ORGANISM="Coccolithus pelagicus ssp braarudi, Strain PLY182g" /LENGTH=52 /DNA_ID=CAMNT_0025505657 /DNA_START=150 /DNA_END=308 /DNA_ORIENTATION=-